MKSYLIMTAIVLCAAIAMAEDHRDVPEAAKHEIARRGPMAIQTGTIRAGLVEAALAPPADDSCKWYLTLVGKEGDPAFEKVKEAIAHSDAMKPWVNAAEPSRSAMHYQVRRIGDETQRDWIKSIQPAIDKFGLPMVIVQPPRNGKFGNPATTVKGIHGLVTGPELDAKLREGIVTYIQTIEVPVQNGISQLPSPPPSLDKPIGVAPPFNLPQQPQNNPAPAVPNNNLPIDWPAAAPQPLTIDQVRAACPGATPEFVMSAIDSRTTSIEVVKLKWEIYLQSHPRPQPAPPEPIEEIVRPRPIHPEEPKAATPEMNQLLIAAIVYAGGMVLVQGLFLAAVIYLIVNRGRKKLDDVDELAAPVMTTASSGPSQAPITPLIPKPSV